jgi:hypothetical protein
MEVHAAALELVAAPLKQDVSSYSLEEDRAKYFLNAAKQKRSCGSARFFEGPTLI